MAKAARVRGWAKLAAAKLGDRAMCYPDIVFGAAHPLRGFRLGCAGLVLLWTRRAAFLCAFTFGAAGCVGTASTEGIGGLDAGVGADARRDVSAPDARLGDAAAGDSATRDASVDVVVGSDAGDLDGGVLRSPGCLDGAGMMDGEHTFMLDGRSRKYVLRLPNGYSRDQAWPLLFALHGNGGNAGAWDREEGERNVRGVVADSAIMVGTEAIDGQWRDYSADESTYPERIQAELRYFDTVLEQVNTALCVKQDEVFTMGFSGGGSFSGVLACYREYIRAFAAGGAVFYFDPDAEPCVNTAGAWITNSTGDASPGRNAYRDFFRDRAECEPSSMPTERAECVAYDGCAPETPVNYCTFPGVHEWPSFGTEAMWTFLKRFIAE